MKYTFILILSFFLYACNSANQQDLSETMQDTPAVLTSNKVELNEEQIRLAEIKIGSLSQQVVSDFVECTGTITLPPQHIMTITPPMGGFVERVNFLPGDYVRKGALLAVLSHQDYISLQQNYLESASALTYATQEYERQKTLAEGNAAAMKKMQESTKEYQRLKAQTMGLAARLRYIGIQPEKIEQNGIQSSIALYAPADAYITEVKANPGKYFGEQDELYELIDKSHLHLDLNVFEKDIAKVKEGQKVYFSLNNDSRRMYEGEVLLVGQKLEKELRAFSVHVDLDDPEDFFRPGMYTQAKIFMGSDSVAAVPEAAIIREDQHNYVFVKSGSEFIRQEVNTGARVNDMVEITNPEVLRDLPVVVKGAYFLEGELNE